MGLFSPGWANKNPEKVIRWIERGKADNEALIQTVLYRNEPEIRKAALARIDDVHTLKRIILKTDDDGLLEEMIRSKARCAYWKKEFSDEAAAKIGSRQVLEELAKDHYACALSRITDEETLCRIAADRNFFRKTEEPGRPTGRDDPADMAAAAFRKLKAPDLPGILQADCFEKVAEAAVKKIKDPQVLQTIALAPDYPSQSRIAALEYVDFPTLEIIAEEEAGNPVGYRALRRIKEIAKGNTDPEFRKKTCAKYGLHEWRYVSSRNSVNGETRKITSTYQCKYCGETTTEEEYMRL